MKTKSVLFCVVLVLVTLGMAQTFHGSLSLALAGIAAVAWLSFVLALWAVIRPFGDNKTSAPGTDQKREVTAAGKSIVGVLLIASLLGLSAPRAQADTGGDGTNTTKVGLCGVIIGCTVLATGGYMVYELNKLCKRKFGEPPPPPPPPPVRTNQPPVTQTNQPPVPRTNAMVSLKLGPDATTSYDITALGYAAPDGSTYASFHLLCLETSDDLVHWKKRTVSVYTSSSSVSIQVDGQPPTLQPVADTWGIDLGLAAQRLQFVRSGGN